MIVTLIIFCCQFLKLSFFNEKKKKKRKDESSREFIIGTIFVLVLNWDVARALSEK